MLTGFILVALLAALVAYAVVKTRRKIGMGVTNRTWAAAFLVTVLIILALWSTGQH